METLQTGQQRQHRDECGSFPVLLESRPAGRHQSGTSRLGLAADGKVRQNDSGCEARLAGLSGFNCRKAACRAVLRS